ncbi:hypothetical protein pb186bvf_009270 [Paramecium bursaria]
MNQLLKGYIIDALKNFKVFHHDFDPTQGMKIRIMRPTILFVAGGGFSFIILQDDYPEFKLLVRDQKVIFMVDM